MRAAAPSTRGTAAAPSAQEPATPLRSATFRTEGGFASVSCRGTTLALVSISPVDGWRFRQEAGADHLDAYFSNGDRAAEIDLGCVGGVPTVTAS